MVRGALLLLANDCTLLLGTYNTKFHVEMTFINCTSIDSIPIPMIFLHGVRLVGCKKVHFRKGYLLVLF